MKVIDCKNKQKEMIEIAKNDTDKIFAETGKKLKLVVFQVEGDDASNVYIRNKKKACEQCGIECEHIKLPTNVTVTELKEKKQQGELQKTMWKGRKIYEKRCSKNNKKSITRRTIFTRK